MEKLTEELSAQEFMELVDRAEPGWSEKFGGPGGVAAFTVVLQERIAELSAQVAAVRTAAIQEQLKERKGVEVARSLGISKAAISRIAHAPTREGMIW